MYLFKSTLLKKKPEHNLFANNVKEETRTWQTAKPVAVVPFRDISSNAPLPPVLRLIKVDVQLAPTLKLTLQLCEALSSQCGV